MWKQFIRALVPCLALTAQALMFLPAARAQTPCHPPQHHPGEYGPFDYRTNKDKLPTVENAHFTPGVATLRREANGPFGADISYTLVAFPNHPRALLSMVNLVLRDKNDKPTGSRYSIECFFKRAVQFAPDDATVRMIEGIYLMRIDRPGQAVAVLETARQMAPNDANINYNLGLALLDSGKPDDALKYAQIAYRDGFPLPGLRDRLEKLGKWKDAEAPAPASTGTN